jgi:hypothetical protein
LAASNSIEILPGSGELRLFAYESSVNVSRIVLLTEVADGLKKAGDRKQDLRTCCILGSFSTSGFW